MVSIRKDPALCSPVKWEEEVEGDFPAEIKVLSEDRPGLLAEISASISNIGSNIESFRMDPPVGNSVQMYIILDVKDRIHLARVMRRIRRLKQVLSVSRIHNQNPTELRSS